jgi:hypothetical protein
MCGGMGVLKEDAREFGCNEGLREASIACWRGETGPP